MNKILVLFVTALLFIGCTSTVKLHKDFETIRPNVKTISVLPPAMEYYEKTATLTEPRPEFDDTLSFVVQTAIEEILSENEYEVMDAQLADSFLIEDQDLALNLTNTMKVFSEAASEIVKENPEIVDKKLNPEIGEFADRAAADYLVLVRGVGYGSTGGAVARDVAIGVVTAVLFGGVAVNQYEGLFIEIAVVDANTTEIIFFNRNLQSNSEYEPLNLSDCKQLVFTLLKEKFTNFDPERKRRNNW